MLIVLYSAFYIVRMRGMDSFTMLVLCALVTGFVGDVLLMIEEVSFFMHGLLFFLVGHIFYICAFARNFEGVSTSFIPVFAVLFAVYLIYSVFIKRLSKNLPMAAYMYVTILFCMTVLAYANVNGVHYVRGLLMAAGATLFAISDFVLGYNTFVREIPHSTVITWSCYAPAQMMIALSCFF